jgi:hypothetical protein
MSLVIRSRIHPEERSRQHDRRATTSRVWRLTPRQSGSVRYICLNRCPKRRLTGKVSARPFR